MQREALLAGGAAVVASALLLAAAVAPGITAAPTEERTRPGHLDIRETSLAAGEVGGETATLDVTTRFQHRGDESSNIEVAYRVVDSDTGLVVDRAVKTLGNVTGDREVSTTVSVTVAREGDYKLRTVVYEDGRRTEQSSTSIRGVGSLTPAYATSPVRFHQFSGAAAIPPIEYGVEKVSDGRATVNISAYLTNGGDEAVEGLRLALVARQADSNIVADEASVELGTIRSGRSATPSATLTVPDNYTYYLDAVLWKDGVIVASARAPADLAPQRTVDQNVTREDVDLDSEQFAAETSTPAEAKEQATRAEGAATEREVGQPGLGLSAGLVALAGAALLARRWTA